MTEFSITELVRGKLYEAVGIVTFRSETVIITRHGQPVAKIVPLDRTTVVSDPTVSIATNLPSTEKSFPPKSKT